MSGEPALRPAGTVAASAAATALGVLPVYLLGALAVQVRQDIRLTGATLGLSVSCYFAVSALASVPAGRLVERVGAGRGMAIGATAGAVSMLVAGTATHWGVLAMGVAVAGIGNATGQVASNLALAQAVPRERQGLAFGIKQGAVPAATALAGLAVPVVGLTLGWRWAYLAGALLPAGFGWWAARCPGLRVQVPVSLDLSAGRQRADMTLRALAILAFSGALGTFAANTLAAFLVDGTVSIGFSAPAAGVLLAVGSLTSVAVRVALGSIVDARRLPLLVVVAVMLATGSAGLLALSGATRPPLVVAAAVAAYLGVWGWNGVFTLSIVRSNPSAPAAATGITQAGLYMGGVVGPTVFGYVVGTSGYPTAWRVAATAALLGATGIAVISRRPPPVLAASPAVVPMPGGTA